MLNVKTAGGPAGASSPGSIGPHPEISLPDCACDSLCLHYGEMEITLEFSGSAPPLEAVLLSFLSREKNGLQ